jgi:putative transposase
VLRAVIDPTHPRLSVRHQCRLLGLPRSSYYYEPAQETAETLRLMRLIDEQYTEQPVFGSRRMTVWLNNRGEAVNRKRVQRLMRLMGLEAIYPKPNLSAGGGRHKVYPYLLRGLSVERVDQVWSTDITYIPMEHGFMYLDMLEEALSRGKPEVFNTDQGVQFTAQAWTERLESAGVKVSMDGKGRCLDNVFVERLWRTVKHEDVYVRRYESVPELHAGLVRFFDFYNHQRPHQSLGYQTPAAVYRARRQVA